MLVAHRFSALRLAALLLTALVFSASSQGSRLAEIKPQTGPHGGRRFYTNSHAVLIGISRYRYLPKGNWLTYADEDARALRQVLIQSYGFAPENIVLLLNEQATRANIEAALSALSDDETVGREDRVLVYFSGHGQTIKLANSGDMGFLIPYDAKVDLSRSGNPSRYLATCLRMDALWGYLEASPAKHALLLADACYGGLLAQSRHIDEKPSPAVVARLLELPARQVMTAGSRGEEAVENPRWGHGAFTYRLLQELRARATQPDAVFLASELAAKLKVSVGNLTDGRQTPQFGNHGSTEGEFLFVSVETPAVTVPRPVSAPRTIPAPARNPLPRRGPRVPAPDPARVAQARKVLAEAEQTARKITRGVFQSRALTEIAVAQAQARDMAVARQTLAQAQQTAQNITSDSYKSYALTGIGRAQTQVGEVDAARQTLAQARQLAQKITEDVFRSYVLVELAVAQTQAGDVDAAQQTVQKITGDSNKSRALAEIAVAQAEAGDMDAAQQTLAQAQRTAQTIINDYSKSRALSGVARAQAQAGYVAAARQTLAQAQQLAQNIPDDSNKSSALVAIALAQAQAGDVDAARQTLDEAQQTAQKITDNRYKSANLAGIALALAQAGDVDTAQQTVLRIGYAFPRSLVLVGIAVAQARAGDMDAALQTAQSITDDYYKSDALAAIAKVLVTVSGKAQADVVKE